MKHILTLTLASLLIVLVGYLLVTLLPVVFFWWLKRSMQSPDADCEEYMKREYPSPTADKIEQLVDKWYEGYLRKMEDK